MMESSGVRYDHLSPAMTHTTSALPVTSGWTFTETPNILHQAVFNGRLSKGNP